MILQWKVDDDVKFSYRFVTTETILKSISKTLSLEKKRLEEYLEPLSKQPLARLENRPPRTRNKNKKQEYHQLRVLQDLLSDGGDVVVMPFTRSVEFLVTACEENILQKDPSIWVALKEVQEDREARDTSSIMSFIKKVIVLNNLAREVIKDLKEKGIEDSTVIKIRDHLKELDQNGCPKRAKVLFEWLPKPLRFNLDDEDDDDDEEEKCEVAVLGVTELPDTMDMNEDERTNLGDGEASVIEQQPFSDVGDDEAEDGEGNRGGLQEDDDDDDNEGARESGMVGDQDEEDDDDDDEEMGEVAMVGDTEEQDMMDVDVEASVIEQPVSYIGHDEAEDEEGNRGGIQEDGDDDDVDDDDDDEEAEAEAPDIEDARANEGDGEASDDEDDNDDEEAEAEASQREDHMTALQWLLNNKRGKGKINTAGSVKRKRFAFCMWLRWLCGRSNGCPFLHPQQQLMGNLMWKWTREDSSSTTNQGRILETRLAKSTGSKDIGWSKSILISTGSRPFS
jgi:hypothetical protein